MSGCMRSASLATPPATPLEPHLAFRWYCETTREGPQQAQRDWGTSARAARGLRWHAEIAAQCEWSCAGHSPDPSTRFMKAR